jgi:F-type H+-transporting ATPase subunit b
MDLHLFINIAKAAAEETAQETNKGAIGTLGLNWKIFIAQLINFGIILFILWKWVFTPVAKKLTQRTEKIEKAMRDAADVQKQKDEFGKWKDLEMTKVRSQTSAIITSAEHQANKLKDQTLQQTKEEQEKIIEQAAEQIEQEKQKAVQDAKSQLADMVTMATEKIIRQKLDEEKDKELIKQSLQSIK